MKSECMRKERGEEMVEVELDFSSILRVNNYQSGAFPLVFQKEGMTMPKK